ncbi:unnamed protein product [Mytilus edulis]|uniref:SGNH hydrolase-type esterase domain-containing protein n=1 Tax=Mytilus edulis TaxID=6550 RepID=A0A8S3R6V1_MYTED|nr:unnamed protein product [Mytilus edulis]
MSKALVLGHSLVRDLDLWTRETSSDFLSNCETHVYGIGGRTTALISKHDICIVRWIQPSIVFLQVGGNDISIGKTAKEIVDNQMKLAREILRIGTKRVIIGSVIGRMAPRGMTTSQYKNKRKKVNKLLKSQESAKIKVWDHKNFHQCHFRDGVHLTDKGNEVFFFSIRHALHSVL